MDNRYEDFKDKIINMFMQCLILDEFQFKLEDICEEYHIKELIESDKDNKVPPSKHLVF